MVVYLAFLLLLGIWRPSLADIAGSFTRIGGDPLLLARGLLILAIYSALDLAIGYWKEKKWILPSSAWISGLILSVVLAPTAPWSLAVAAPVLASLSKHFIRIRRKHVLNPAATALVVLGFLFPSVGVISWWGAAWGFIPLVIIAASGLFTIFRIKRWKTWLGFFLVYIVGSSLILLIRGSSFQGPLALLLDGTFWFFSTVMLVEPVTTAYTPASIRTWFGAGVGVLTLLFAATGSLQALPDPFLVALLLGNLGGTIVSMRARR